MGNHNLIGCTAYYNVPRFASKLRLVDRFLQPAQPHTTRGREIVFTDTTFDLEVDSADCLKSSGCSVTT